MSSWTAWAESELAAIRAAGRWRETTTFDAFGPRGTVDAGPGGVVSFASNDYLGLSGHPAVINAATEAAGRWGAGATASRLIVGSRPVHAELEAEIARWKGAERALVFSSGYTANLGVLTTFGGPDVTIFSDELNHASIIDGSRLGRCRVAIYRHGDADHLAALLRSTPGRAVVVSDSVFSMDGDVAPIDALIACCAERGALLVLDEAHAVLGPHIGSVDDADLVRVGTLSKTLGSLGGWVAGTAPMIDLLVNRARSFIFTTGLTPADTAAALAAIRILQDGEGASLLCRLAEVVERVRAGNPSPIVPIMLGDERRAVNAAAALLERGLLVPAIRPPTVAPGTCRLRVALSAAHSDAMVDRLIDALDALGPER